MDGEILLPTNGAAMAQYGASLWLFFEMWMQEWPLAQCLQAAGNPALDYPLDQRYSIFGYPNLRRSPTAQP